MPISDEDVAVGRHRNIGRAIEHVRSVTGLTGRPYRHQQLPIARVLENLLALAVLAARVGEPEKPVAVDANPVRVDKTAAPRLQYLARLIELDHVGLVAM